MMRYSHPRGYHMPSRPRRYRPLLLIGVVVLAAFLIFRSMGVGGINESHYEARRNGMLRSEVQHAVSCVNSLSRLGASSTSAMLGRIRQYVHGVETLNELNVGMYGTVGSLYPVSTFDAIYSAIEEYEARLSSGQKVNDTLQELRDAVTLLNNQTQALLGVSTDEEGSDR